MNNVREESWAQMASVANPRIVESRMFSGLCDSGSEWVNG